MIVKRVIIDRILKSILPNKVIIIAGARRTGKTVILKEIIKTINEPHIFLNGEDILTHELLSRRTAINYKNLMGNTRFLIIDEAQKIDEIGIKLNHNQ